MYNEEIQKILEKHYGRPQKTLTVEEQSTRGRCTYYYSLTLPNRTKILQMQEILSNGLGQDIADGFSELKQTFSIPFGSTGCLAQCACYTEDEGEWTIRFYPITGVRYHKKRRSIATTVILGSKPVVTLYGGEPQTFFGYFRRSAYSKRAKRQANEGLAMSYWLNKNLHINRCFRDFTVDFFDLIGQQTKCYILKDIAHAIRKYGFYLPAFSFEEMMNFHKPKEYITAIMPDADRLSANLNAIDLNMAYVISVLAPHIRRSDWHFLKSLPPEIITDAVTLNSLFNGIEIEDIVAAYYERKLVDDEDESEWPCNTAGEYACDYARMCIETDTPISLRHTYHSMVKAHDSLSQMLALKAKEQDLKTPLIARPSQFDPLERSLNLLLPGEFERIVDAPRLLKEETNQRNCVFSRRSLVRRDRAAIFHWQFADAPYTIQFALDDRSNYYIEEIGGKCNTTCPIAGIAKLTKILRRVQDYCFLEKFDDSLVYSFEE